MAFNPDDFFVSIKQSLFGRFSQGHVEGLTALLDATSGWRVEWRSYGLATAFHETAGTMQPIKEYGGDAYLTRLYDVTGSNPDRARRYGNTAPGDGALYCGRGYVQLTWKANYQRASDATGFDLVANPDLALRADIAAIILRRGMEGGWFTGKELGDYLNSTAKDYVGARRIINGTDKAGLIAGYATKFEAALKTAAAPTVPADFATVRIGSRGETVRQVQAALGVTADGVFGPATERAVISYQKTKSLTPDGIVGPQTARALGLI